MSRGETSSQQKYRVQHVTGHFAPKLSRTRSSRSKSIFFTGRFVRDASSILKKKNRELRFKLIQNKICLLTYFILQCLIALCKINV